MPNVFRIFEAPSRIVAKMAVIDMRKLTGASEHHITYCYNINNEDDVEVHIGGQIPSATWTHVSKCASTSWTTMASIRRGYEV